MAVDSWGSAVMRCRPCCTTFELLVRREACNLPLKVGVARAVMTYNAYFEDALARLKEECRYRVFADLERIAGRFPYAIWHCAHGAREVVLWCSNDYLGMPCEGLFLDPVLSDLRVQGICGVRWQVNFNPTVIISVTFA
jgi:hypothetical protein